MRMRPPLTSSHQHAPTPPAPGQVTPPLPLHPHLALVWSTASAFFVSHFGFMLVWCRLPHPYRASPLPCPTPPLPPALGPLCPSVAKRLLQVLYSFHLGNLLGPVSFGAGFAHYSH